MNENVTIFKCALKSIEYLLKCSFFKFNFQVHFYSIYGRRFDWRVFNNKYPDDNILNKPVIFFVFFYIKNPFPLDIFKTHFQSILLNSCRFSIKTRVKSTFIFSLKKKRDRKKWLHVDLFVSHALKCARCLGFSFSFIVLKT